MCKTVSVIKKIFNKNVYYSSKLLGLVLRILSDLSTSDTPNILQWLLAGVEMERKVINQMPKSAINEQQWLGNEEKTVI